MIETIVSILLLVGAFFALAGAIGLVRFPDVYSRMHAAGLVSTAGIGLLFIAEVAYFSALRGAISFKGLIVLAFVMLTLPVSTHMLGRAAYRARVPLASISVIDEREGRVRPRVPTLPTVTATDQGDELA